MKAAVDITWRDQEVIEKLATDQQDHARKQTAQLLALKARTSLGADLSTDNSAR